MEQLDQNFSHQSQELNENPKEKGLNQLGVTSIVVAVILILLVLGNSYIFFTTSKDNPQSQKHVPTDPTANWKTYNDHLNRFSFKYPDVGFRSLNNDSVEVGINYKHSQDDEEFKKAFDLKIEVTKHKSNLTLEQLKDTPIQSFGESEFNKVSKNSIHNYDNGEIHGIIHDVIFDNGDQYGGFQEIVTIKGDLIYSFSFENLGGPVEAGGRETVDQILSTFKFTDSIAPCPSGISKEIPC